jgi:glycosyltransferase involved in cell wall biosynthesis
MIREQSAQVPRISIIVFADSRPGFPRERFLLSAVQSVMEQDLAPGDFEVIITKNFTSTNVDQQLAKIGVRVLFDNTPNVASRRMHAIDASSAPLVGFLSDDDLFEPTRLRKVLEVFDAFPGTGFYRNQLVHINALGLPFEGASLRRPSGGDPRISGRLPRATPEFDQIASRAYLRGNATCESTIVVRREILDGGTIEGFRTSFDTVVYFAALLSTFDLYFDERILTRYRLHEFNHTLDKSRDLMRFETATRISAIARSRGYPSFAAAVDWDAARTRLIAGMRSGIDRADIGKRLADWSKTMLDRPGGRGFERGVVDLLEGIVAISYFLSPSNVHHALYPQRLTNRPTGG